MWLVVLITITAFVILSYMVPFSRWIKWIENSTNAYYLAYAWIEKALYHVKTRPFINSETWSVMPNTAIWYSYNTFSSWTQIPLPGSWNSEFDKDYNIISPAEPLQLEVWKWYQTNNWNSVSFLFRVPNLDNNSSTTETLSWGTLPVINWLLSSQNNTLIASGTYLKANDVKSSNVTSWVNIFSSTSAFRFWSTLSWSSVDFQTYYSNNCWPSSWCTLKFSIINQLELTTNKTKIPYLEYKITWLSNNFPDRYTKIKSSWKSYWFQKNLEVRVPQQTVNQALDFTVFQ
jgi:hypothetical protein